MRKLEGITTMKNYFYFLGVITKMWLNLELPMLLLRHIWLYTNDLYFVSLVANKHNSAFLLKMENPLSRL